MSGDTVRTLPNGYEYVLVHFYSSGEAKANILPTIVSFFELIATVGLLTAIVLSAVFTRHAKDSNLFVRTSLVFYFVSALVCEALSALSGVMTATWISDMQVFSGGLCTAQGFFKHFSDVGLAIWTVVITVQAFIVLWRAQESSQDGSAKEFTFALLGRTLPAIMFYKWFILSTTWFAIGFIVMLGPAIGSGTDHGDFYGVFGESCGITAGYLPESVVFSSLVIIIAFLTSIGLFVWICYAIKPRSFRNESEVGFPEKSKDKAGRLSVEVARYMTWYPLVYFVCVLPAIIETIIYWSGTAIPVGYSVFVDTVYHLMGIINASVFVFTPHPGPLLPHKPESLLPPESPRDLNAEAEKVKAQIVAAGVSLDGNPDDPPSPPEPVLPREPEPLIRRPSRGRELPFPVATAGVEPVQVYVSYEVESTARDGKVELTPISERAEDPGSAAQGEKVTTLQRGKKDRSEEEHTVAGPKHDGNVASAKEVEASTPADKSETRQSGVPSSVYSQNSQASPTAAHTPTSPLRIVIPARTSTRPGRDQPFPVVTLPSNPRPKGDVEVRVEGTEKQPEITIVVQRQPPPYPTSHSPPSPQTAPAVFDQSLVAAVRDAPPSPSPSPLAGSKSRFAKEQDRWLKRVRTVSRRTIPVPWLPQRPDGEPHSPDSFMDAEAAAIERSLSLSEHSNSNPDSPNLNANAKRRVRFASQSQASFPSNEWYVGLLQAAGLGARVSRQNSRTELKAQSHDAVDVVPHSAPIERRDVAAAWKPYRDAFKAAGTGTAATSAATSPLSPTQAEADADAESEATLLSANASPEVKKGLSLGEALLKPSIIVTDVDVDVAAGEDGPVSGLDDEVLVAQKARRPAVPAHSVLLQTARPHTQSEADLDAVLSKWGAKKRDSAVLPTAAADERTDAAVGGGAAAGEYGMESVWTVRPVPDEEGVWECEERIVDFYMNSRSSLRDTLIAAAAYLCGCWLGSRPISWATSACAHMIQKANYSCKHGAHPHLSKVLGLLGLIVAPILNTAATVHSTR
ncbi:unnamed protein product [Peniophora sp. CBMAI 1063]|nr:unnamed protein product [Peniophora sp. CBMAI 1063]